MRRALLAAAEGQGGVITRADALRVARRHVVDDAVGSGALLSAHPGVYVLPDVAGDHSCRAAAAVAYTGGALSHLDALAAWDLLPPAPYVACAAHDPVHVTVCDSGRQVRRPGLVVHRRRGFTVEPPMCRIRRGLPIVRLEQAIVDSWPLIAESERRGPVIVAVRGRQTTGVRLAQCVSEQPRPPCGVASLRRLIELVDSGCHSELELFGHDRVLVDPRLPPARAQVPITLPQGRVYLDRLFDAELVDVEFDGAAYHGSASQRERDLARDAALACLGVLVVRFTHQRLTQDPHRVREELIRILAMRRQQLRSA